MSCSFLKPENHKKITIHIIPRWFFPRYISFQHPNRGHFVPPFWIFTSASSNRPGNILIGLFDPQNLWFDTKKSILRCTVPEILDPESWWRPSWKMAPCVNCTHFWRCHHAVSWLIDSVIDFNHADKCCYSAAGTLLFLGPLLQH